MKDISYYLFQVSLIITRPFARIHHAPSQIHEKAYTGRYQYHWMLIWLSLFKKLHWVSLSVSYHWEQAKQICTFT